MKDDIEKYIDANRQKFDDLEVNAVLWSKIKKELPKQRAAKSNWAWKVAATILLFLSVGLLYERSMKQVENADTSVVMNEELIQVEKYYSEMIQQKMSEIKLASDKVQLDNMELAKELETLDQMYLKLKDDLAVNENNERLINAMIRNLQLRVEILNRQLKILEQLTNYENEGVAI